MIRLKNTSAIALFAVTVATVAVMWQQAFWATALPEVAVFCLVACWLALYMANAAEVRIRLVLIPLVAAALWPLIQLAFGTTIYRWATSVAALYWAAAAAVVFVAIQIFDDAAIRQRYLRALVILGFVVAIISPLQLYTGDGRIYWLFAAKYSDIAMGPFVYTNQYAAFIELILPIALTQAFSDRSGWRTFHGLAAAVMYASIFASTSRTGFVLTSVEILTVPVLAARRAEIGWRKMALSGTVFLVMLVVLGLAVGPDRLMVKLSQKDPYLGRREYAESSLRMIPEHPFIGVGMGNWPAAYPAYAIFDEGYFANQAHNDWAQWAVEGGVPFFLMLLTVAVWSFPRALRSGWGSGICAVFFQCLVDYPIQRIGVAVIFFTLIGAIAFPNERELRGRGRRRPGSAGLSTDSPVKHSTGFDSRFNL